MIVYYYVGLIMDHNVKSILLRFDYYEFDKKILIWSWNVKNKFLRKKDNYIVKTLKLLKNQRKYSICHYFTCNSNIFYLIFNSDWNIKSTQKMCNFFYFALQITCICNKKVLRNINIVYLEIIYVIKSCKSTNLCLLFY